MGFRFRRSIKILPGVRLNFSKSGVSTSIGVPGATVNLSKKGTRTTVGVPGTGVSYTETSARHKPTPEPAPDRGSDGDGTWFLWAIAVLAAGMVLYGLLTNR